MQTVMFMKVSGKMTKHMAKENILMEMEQYMKVTGRTTNSMGME